MHSLSDLHQAHTGKVSDKWASYLAVYDRTFNALRERPVSLLEIGVQNGGSLEVWSRYFPAATHIVGCDIHPRCRNLRYSDPRISVVVADINSRMAKEQIADLCPAYDIVIDDGSHISDDIIRTFLIYFPMLKPGGIFVVEDTHTMYWDNYQGGVLRQTSAYGFFRHFVDLVNYEHWKSELSLATLFNTFFSKRQTPKILLAGWVDGIEFFNSMVIIRKSAQPGHAKLGQRLIAGKEASVNAEVLKFRRSPDDEPFS